MKAKIYKVMSWGPKDRHLVFFSDFHSRETRTPNGTAIIAAMSLQPFAGESLLSKGTGDEGEYKIVSYSRPDKPLYLVMDFEEM